MIRIGIKNIKTEIIMRYVFATKLNDTEAAGILDLHTGKLLCVCTEENSKIIIDALKKAGYDVVETQQNRNN